MEQLSHNSDQGETWLTQVYASVANFGNEALGSSLEDQVEWPRRGFADLPALADDFGELGLTCLRTQAFADFLVQ
jgi:hypothetical protein